MNINHLLASENDNFGFVAVVFPGTNKQYHYKTIDATIEVDDFVVVDTPQNGLTVARVVDRVTAYDVDTHITYKWIVQKVDVEAYERQKEAERDLKKAIAQAKLQRQKNDFRQQLNEAIGEEAAGKVTKLARL